MATPRTRVTRPLAMLLLVLAVGLGGCSSPVVRTRPDSVALAARTVELPAEFIDDAIVVEVMINGTGPHRLILDTGSAVSQVSPSVARLAGLRRTGTARTVDAHGGRYREALTRVDRLEVGGLTARGVPFTINDLPEAVAAGGMGDGEGPQRRAVGVLGYHVFTSCTLDLDYPACRVRATSERLRPSDPAVLPLSARRTRVPFVEGVFRIPGEPDADFPSTLLVDTGSGAVMTVAGMDAILLPDRDTTAQIGATMSANGTIQPAHFARLNFDLHLGQVVATRVMALVPERAGDGDSAIGARLLRQFRVRLDPVSGRARFDHPDGLTEVPMPVWRIHGFTVTLENSPLPVITEVNPGSPAEAGGLLVGDVVLAIDGRSLGDSLDAWPGPTTDQAITDREFVVRRGDATVTLRLGLTEYLEEPYFYRLFQKNAARAAAQADETQPEVADSTPKEPAQDATPTTSTP